MIRRILTVWLVANFVVVGLASVLARQWYIGWPLSPIAKMWAELGLVMLPNLLLPVMVLKSWWVQPINAVPIELGWVWNKWKSVLTGMVMFAILYGVLNLTSNYLGGSIPYHLPQDATPVSTNNLLSALGLLLGILGFVAITVVGEETMFRGLVQTQIGKQYNALAGILASVVLFGLRHLPNDIYYAQVWRATPQMWLSREVQLYFTAVLLGLARHIGKSTYASAITHGLLLVTVLFGL